MFATMSVRRVLIVVALALLALAGLRGVLFHLPWEWPNHACLAVAATIPDWIKGLVWLGALAIPVGLLVEAIAHGPGRSVLELKGRDGGKMVLRRTVIVKIIRESVAELPEIDKLSVSAWNSPKGLRLAIGVKAKALTSVPELEQAIRSRVDDSLRRFLGIQAIDSIHIRLDDISLSDRIAPRVQPEAGTPLPPPLAPLVDKAEAQGEAPGEPAPESAAQSGSFFQDLAASGQEQTPAGLARPDEGSGAQETPGESAHDQPKENP